MPCSIEPHFAFPAFLVQSVGDRSASGIDLEHGMRFGSIAAYPLEIHLDQPPRGQLARLHLRLQLRDRGLDKLRGTDRLRLD